MKVETEKSQSDAGQAMRCLQRGPESQRQAQAHRNRKPLQLVKETYKTKKETNEVLNRLIKL
jgi:hypothetical protein